MCRRCSVYVQGEIQYLHLVRQGRGGGYTPITDFNIDSNPVTDPITDFYLLARLIIFLFGTDESSLGNDELNSLHKVVYVFQRIIGALSRNDEN